MNSDLEISLKDLKFNHSSVPDVRDSNLKKAKMLYDSGQISESIFLQTKLLNMGFTSKNPGCDDSDSVFDLFSGELTFESKPTDSKLIKFALQKAKKDYEKLMESRKKNNLDFQSMEEITSFCKDLPDEWTVLQVCKDHDKTTTTLKKNDILKRPCPIYLTVLKHPRSSEFPEPICIKIEQSGLKMQSMYSTFADISINFKEYIVFSGEKTKANLEKYMRTCKNFEENIEKVKRSFKNFLGPFATLFAGNVPRNCSTQQKKIFQEVDEFCDRFPKISTRNRVFLSLFSRQVDKLRPEDIKMAGKLLSEGDTNLQESIEAFLSKNQLLKNDLTFNQCILIIDEHLDHMYWESLCLNPLQEVCRFSCFDTLAKLYKKYEPNIKNGYLAINIKNGTAVVNPDGNLPDNEKRMKLFFDYWMPSWNVLFNTKPTPEDFEKFFQSDCYIYMGHGHGSQLLSGSKISEMNVNAVVFLFGCDSVRLTSMGHHAEMIASHIYYHNALCPAVVGSLVIGLDLSMDVLSTQIISSWIASKKTKHWSTMNMKAWKDGTIQQNPNSTAATPSHERRLACAVAKARAYESEKNYNKVGLVYRGLPVYNVSRSKM